MYTYVYICRCRCIHICISRPPQTPGSPDRTPASACGDTPNKSRTHTGSSWVTWAGPGKYVQAWVSWLMLLWLLRKKSCSSFAGSSMYIIPDGCDQISRTSTNDWRQSTVLRDLLIENGNKMPELGAYDVKISVRNLSPDVLAFEGELKDLLCWLGDTTIGVSLVFYSNRLERHVLDSLDAFCVALVDHSACNMWWEWRLHKQEDDRKRPHPECSGCCIKARTGKFSRAGTW